MAKDLEKKHKTKVVFAEICIIADNGEAVYRMWSTPETGKSISTLENLLLPKGYMIDSIMKEHISKSIPFGFVCKFGINENDSLNNADRPN
jgi:hypothetical protein